MIEPRSSRHNKLFQRIKSQAHKDYTGVYDQPYEENVLFSSMTRILRDLFRNLFSLRASIVESKKLLNAHDANLLFIYNSLVDKNFGEITKSSFNKRWKNKYARNVKTSDLTLLFEK